MKSLKDIDWSNIITTICSIIIIVCVCTITLVLLLAIWSNIAGMLIWKIICTIAIAMEVSWLFGICFIWDL